MSLVLDGRPATDGVYAAADSFFAVPLAGRIHEGVKFTNRDRRTLPGKCCDLLDSLALGQSFYFVADAYYACAIVAQCLRHGIPTFLDQLIETLTLEQTAEPDKSLSVRNARGEFAHDVGTTAALHGRDLFLQGFTIEQVVRDYGDACQAVTNLAVETGASIEVEEFRTFNRCLDNAIAGAVTEYAQHTTASNDDNVQTSNSRLGPFTGELRNHLHTAILAVTAMKAGGVGTGGATAAVLDQSLRAMRDLIDPSLA